MASREYIDILHTKLHSINLFTRFFVLPVSLFLFSPLPSPSRNGKSIFREQKPRYRSCSTWWTRFNGFSDVQELVEIRRSKPRWRNHLLLTRFYILKTTVSFAIEFRYSFQSKVPLFNPFLNGGPASNKVILSTLTIQILFHATNSNQKKKKKLSLDFLSLYSTNCKPNFLVSLHE